MKLVVIADDFTGALDTGIQFAEKGLKTKVIVDRNYDFSSTEKELQVLVINAETRHLHPERAYEVVYKITKSAKESGIEIIYKKTDSALRGCIGSELTAVLDATGVQELEFIPAFPKANRTTVKGVHYLVGVPIHESVFGLDPFEPVRNSFIPDIIKEQSNVGVSLITMGELAEIPSRGNEKQIVVFDAQTDEDLKEIACHLKSCGKLKVLAGCAGFAAFLPEFLEFEKTEIESPKRTDGLFVVCGSLNPITKKQVNYAEKNGFNRITITLEQRVNENYLKEEEGKSFLKVLEQHCKSNQALILDTFDDDGFKQTESYAKQKGISVEAIRTRIASRLGELTKEWLSFNLDHTVVLTGGDTLLGFMNQINCQEIIPICEISQGVVLSSIQIKDRELQVISKSGGFGEESVLVDIVNKLGDYQIFS